MFNFVNQMRAAAQNRARYNQTVNELNAMSVETAIDLGMFHDDFDTTAEKAVYGR